MNPSISLSTLHDIADEAAALYICSGNEAAADAAQLMKAASPGKPVDAPRALDVLEHLQSIAIPRLGRNFGSLVQNSLSSLPWTDRGFSLPDGIRGQNAYAELIGPTGPMISDQCRFGFYLQAPNCLYPAHSHAAEEFYYILSGSAEWRLDEDEIFMPPVPDLIHHLPWQKHEMRTGHAPLLAMWIWTGDIGYSTYSIRSS